MKKRRFLILLSSAAAGIASLPYLKPLIYDLGEAFVPTMPESSATGALSSAEVETLLAYAEALSDDRDFSEETRQYMRTHIINRTETKPGFLSLFRMTCTILDELSGEGFSKLPRADRIFALEKRGLMSCRVHRRECFSPFGRKERMIRAFAATELVSAYYRSAAGWAVVSYSNARGNCSDLNRYTHAEA